MAALSAEDFLGSAPKGSTPAPSASPSAEDFLSGGGKGESYQSPDYSPGAIVGSGFNEVAGAAKSIFNNAKDVPQLASDIYQTGKQIPSILTGKTNVIDTPMGQRMVDSAANAAPYSKGVKTAVQHPLDWAVTHPVAAGMMIYGGYQGAKGLLSSAPQALADETGAVRLGGGEPPAPELNPTGPAPKAAPTGPLSGVEDPNYLEKVGSANINSGMGIRRQTIEALTPKGQNPGEIGIQLGQKLQNAGVPNEGMGAFNKLYKPGALLDQAGQKVSAANQALVNEASRYGAVENPLSVHADVALEPLLDKWMEKANSITGLGRSYAEEFENVHNGLSKIAESQGGHLTLDNIDKALDEIGPLTHKGSDANQAVMSDLYHSVANVRDNMVKAVAEQAKNPALRDNFISANREYSFLKRLQPDISHKSAMESIGQKTLAGIGEDIKNSIFSRGASRAGQAFKGTSTAVKGAAVPIFSKGAFRPPEE